jgi:hypothetical protein
VKVGTAFVVAILILLGCLFAGAALMAHGIPGITHDLAPYSAVELSSRPSLSPDSSRVAYALSVKYAREPRGVFRLPDGGSLLITGENVDLWVFGLSTPGGPQRAFRRPAHDVTASECAWTRDGIYFYFDDRQGSHYYLVNPDKHRTRSLKAGDGKAALLRYGDLSAADWQAARHVEFERGRFFLWNPQTSTRSFLLELPGTYDGHPVNAGFGW